MFRHIHVTIPHIRVEIKQNSIISHTHAPPPPPTPPERVVDQAARYFILGL
jgi:hypothetical protein